MSRKATVKKSKLSSLSKTVKEEESSSSEEENEPVVIKVAGSNYKSGKNRTGEIFLTGIVLAEKGVVSLSEQSAIKNMALRTLDKVTPSQKLYHIAVNKITRDKIIPKYTV